MRAVVALAAQAEAFWRDLGSRVKSHRSTVDGMKLAKAPCAHQRHAEHEAASRSAQQPHCCAGAPLWASGERETTSIVAPPCVLFITSSLPVVHHTPASKQAQRMCVRGCEGGCSDFLLAPSVCNWLPNGPAVCSLCDSLLDPSHTSLC